MKKVGVILLIFSLLISIFPATAAAAENTNFDQELAQYLNGVSAERGFEVTKEDIEAVLSASSDSLDNYETVADLKSSLGEVIKADLSNLTYIYDEYKLDQDKLQQLLQDNGEELNDYIYLDDLIFAVYFYQEDEDVVKDPNFDQNLADYLTKVSDDRGFEVTKAAIEATLQRYEMSLDDFGTVDQLSDFLGEVIKADLSNLNYFNETYGLDKEALLNLLKENKKDIKDYVYIDDLEQFVWTSYDGELPEMDDILGSLTDIMDKIGFTDKEFQNLIDYFSSMEEYFSDPQIAEQFDAIGTRLMAFSDISDTTELTKEQMTELASIYKDMLSIFKLEAVLTLETNGKQTPITFEDLFQLKDIKDLKDSKLKVQLFSTDSQLLADFVITSDMFASIGEEIEDSAEEVIDTLDKPAVTKPVKTNVPEIKTVKGGQLPKTASAYIPNALLGLFIAFAGISLYRKVRNAESEIKNN